MAAARFVMEKNATEKDLKRTSEEIVREVLKYKEKFRDEAESPRQMLRKQNEIAFQTAFLQLVSRMERWPP